MSFGGSQQTTSLLFGVELSELEKTNTGHSLKFEYTYIKTLTNIYLKVSFSYFVFYLVSPNWGEKKTRLVGESHVSIRNGTEEQMNSLQSSSVGPRPTLSNPCPVSDSGVKYPVEEAGILSSH